MKYSSYLKEGAQLRDNTYRIVKVLGQGGFGITYLAVHTSLNKRVAIKEFFPKTFCNRDEDTSHVKSTNTANTYTVERLKTKFIKEAQHIAKMSSPYIVKIVDIFEENDTVYYIMDYIEGMSLSDMVKANGPMPEEQAVEYITKVGEALTYVHSQNMNHLDVKPANIMVRKSDNAPVLIDFGLSKQYDSEGNQTSTTPVGISHGYAPMEQYNDGGVKEFSPQTDLYSLAATLYYLLSGIVPTQAPRLIDEELNFPPSIPPALVGPISKAMSSARRARHATVAEFISELSDDSATEILPVQRQPSQPHKRVPESPVLSATVEDQEQAAEAQKPEERPSQHSMPRKQPPVQDPDDDKKPDKKMIIGAVAGLALVLIAGVIFLMSSGGAGDADDNLSNVTDMLSNVTDMQWTSPFGECIYTGPAYLTINEDGDTIKKEPHGKGFVIVTNGSIDYIDEKNATQKIDISGNTYEGDIRHGMFDGQATYTIKQDGQKFVGTFQNNEYKEGKLTLSDGAWFEGTFNNKMPEKGSWYNKDGTLLKKIHP